MSSWSSPNSNALVELRGCPECTVGTIVFPTGADGFSDEVERDIRTAIVNALRTIDTGTTVAGSDGIEVGLATSILERANGVGDRTSIPMEAYADALEEAPPTRS